MAEDRIAGKLALITGGARGIGLATARALVAGGSSVALCDVDEQAVKAAAQELAALGATAKAWKLDVCDPEAFEQVVDEVEREQGPIDILVNNAGIMPLGGFLDQHAHNDRRQIEINVFGVAHGMRAVLPRMLRRDRGHVVNIASAAGKVGIPFAAMYSASKHAVVGLTEAVRQEHRGSNVHFTYVMPSLVDTELISGAGRMHFPPLATAEDVATSVVDAVRRGKVDVFVPRSARLAAVLPVLVPRRIYERMGRILGIDRIFADVDRDARAAYDRRAELKGSGT